MTRPEIHDVDGLITVTIDHRGPQPHVVAHLDPRHDGTVHPHTPDIDDFLKDWKPGAAFFDSRSGHPDNQRRLLILLEQLTCWDNNRDGVVDTAARNADAAIRQALAQAKYPVPTPFYRPTKPLWPRLLMAIMNLFVPQPAGQVTYSLGDLRQRFRWFHLVFGVVGVIAFITLLNVQVMLVPALRYSVITGGLAAYHRYGVIVVIVAGAYIGLSRRITRNGRSMGEGFSFFTIGLFNRAAVWEEQLCRQGAERWNWFQRTVSCLVFALLHLSNLIYPLASVLPLALGGAWFMYVYLNNYKHTHNQRLAVLAAAVVHRAYNRIALIAMALWLVLFVGDWVYGLAFGATMTVSYGYSVIRHKLRQQTIEPAPEPAEATA